MGRLIKSIFKAIMLSLIVATIAHFGWDVTTEKCASIAGWIIIFGSIFYFVIDKPKPLTEDQKLEKEVKRELNGNPVINLIWDILFLRGLWKLLK